MPAYQRLAARRGGVVELPITFLRGGVLTDPYAIRRVDIYRAQVLEQNLVVTVPVGNPWETGYPGPIEQLTEDVPAGECGTAPVSGALLTGRYQLNWLVPVDAVVPDVYYDVWSFLPTNPCDLEEFAGTSTVCEDGHYPDLDADALAGLMLKLCSRFWVYPDGWNLQDNLSSIRLGFEPLDQRFSHPEIRPLEVGIMPLPLYQYDYNLVAPILPYLTGTITIETLHREVLVQNAPLEIGLRQGLYRSNPYVLRYLLDTSSFLIGTYRYRVTVMLPDGTKRTSRDFIFTIS